MKVERTRQLQSQRVDREKANVPRIVQQIPNSGRQGDTVIIESTNEQYIFDRGTWRGVGVSREATEEIAEEAVANAPQASRASLIRTVDVRVNAGLIDTTEFDQPFEYEVGKNPARTEFRIRWYLTLEAWQDQTPEADVGDAPITIEWLPPTPVETEGIHRGVLRYKLNPNTTGEFNFFGDIDVI